MGLPDKPDYAGLLTFAGMPYTQDPDELRGVDVAIAEPDIRACAARHGPLGLVHFDTHTDTGTEVFGVEPSHGTPMRALVEAGHVDPSRYVQIGLRGYWPGPTEFDWQRDRGITSFF